MNTKHSEYLKERKTTILQKEILSPEDYDFYEALFKYGEIWSQRYSGGMNTCRSSNDLPVLKAQSVAIPDSDVMKLEAALKELAAILSLRHSGLNLDGFIAYFTQEGSSPQAALNILLSEDMDGLEMLTKHLKVGIEELVFILVNWFKPYLINLRLSGFEDCDTSEWHSSRCPFCGYYPSMAKIVEIRENQKILHCSLCECEWQFNRIGCVICGNEDFEKMGFYEFEDDPAYRFDYCKSCNGYIKTVRIPKKFEEKRFDLTVEDIITNFLDASAMKMGFKRL